MGRIDDAEPLLISLVDQDRLGYKGGMRQLCELFKTQGRLSQFKHLFRSHHDAMTRLAAVSGDHPEVRCGLLRVHAFLRVCMRNVVGVVCVLMRACLMRVCVQGCERVLRVRMRACRSAWKACLCVYICARPDPVVGGFPPPHLSVVLLCAVCRRPHVHG